MGTSKYPGMMIYCRPMTNVNIETLVIPGSHVHHAIHLTFKPDTKYYPYLIPDKKLKEFTEQLYESVLNGSKTTEANYTSKSSKKENKKILFGLYDVCNKHC